MNASIVGFYSSCQVLGVAHTHIAAAQRACAALPLDANSSFYEQLRSWHWTLGIRLMAYQLLTTVVRMAANMLVLQHDELQVLTVPMESSIAEPQRTAERIGEFVAGVMLKGGNWTPASVGKALGDENARRYESKKEQGSSHLTSHQVDERRAAELRDTIEKDAVLAPFLAAVRQAALQTTRAGDVASAVTGTYVRGSRPNG